MSTAINLRQIFPPICTAFTPAGDLALTELAANIRRYNQAILGGYVVTGSTGEAVMLTESERSQVWETVRDTALPGHLLIAGTAAQSTRETISMTATAASIGYHAALVLTPSFFKAQMVRPETQIAFFHTVADAAKIPVLLYNFPGVTGVDLDPDLMARIVEHENIIGLKESSADLEKIKKLRAALKPGFPLLVGASGIFAQCLQAGADGGILASANALPEETSIIFEQFRTGNVDAALASQALIKDAAGIPPKYGIGGLKYAMDCMGMFGGECRHPLLPLDDAAKQAIAEVYKPFQRN